MAASRDLLALLELTERRTYAFLARSYSAFSLAYALG